MLILFNKPFGVLTQFRASGDTPTLADYIKTPNVYPAGRLDKDSEGLLLLTDDGKLAQRLTNPRFDKAKTYIVQVDGDIDDRAIEALQNGLQLKDGQTKPAKAHKINPPDLWPRNPPVRFRQNIPTSWISITITEGRNRQVRRMTAAVGFPTLRLIRTQIDRFELKNLAPGEQIKLQNPGKI
ncbi:MAG: pseudouridine synthase [Gammaproteobacteria bacterium]|nr:pseudouridine synthase [Gammaproteobacteria bacterium]